MAENQSGSVVLRELKSDIIPLGQKCKKWNQYLQNSSTQELQDLYSSLQGSDVFSARLKIDIADRLQISSAIIDALKSEHTLLIRRAVRCKWAFKNDSALTDLATLNQIFPTISFSCRLKIINGLGINLDDANIGRLETKAQQIFEFVEKNYGLSLASVLLSKCSNEFIIETLDKHPKLKLSFKQMNRIADKDPFIITKFISKQLDEKREFEELNHINITQKTDDYNKILTHLLTTKPDIFIDFYRKYEEHLDLNLGRIASKKFLQVFHQRILENSVKFSTLLKTKEIAKLLTKETLGEVFAGQFPKKLTNFRDSAHSAKTELTKWSKYVTPDILYAALQIGFQKLYEQRMEECLPDIPADILRLLPPVERIRFADLKKESSSSQDAYNEYNEVARCNNKEAFWLRLHPIETSVPKLKEMLKIEQEVSGRAELVGYLVDTCAINKDANYFYELCGWFPDRYRNDDCTVRSNFIDACIRNLKDLKTFIQEWNWEGIETLFGLYHQYNEELASGTLLTFLMTIIEYRIDQNLSMETYIPVLIKAHVAINKGNDSYNFSCQNGRIQNACNKRQAIFELKSRTSQITLINSISKEVDKQFPKDFPEKFSNLLLNLVNTIASWNLNHKKSERISLTSFPGLLTLVDNYLAKAFCSGVEIFVTQVHAKLHLMQDLAAVFDSKENHFQTYFKTIPDIPVIESVHKRNPSAISENLEFVLNFLMTQDNNVVDSEGTYYIHRCNRLKNKVRFNQILRFFGNLAKNGYLELSEAVADKCFALITAGTPGDQLVTAVNLLSVVDSAGKYLKMLEGHVPTDTKIDLRSTDDAAEAYRLKSAIPASLTRIQPASIGLPPLVQFCKGDYLKLSLGSLYSLCSRSNPQNCLTFLQPILEQPTVSVKKHAIRLVCLNKTTEETIQLIQQLWKTEEHLSIRHVIFHETLKILRESISCPMIWEFLKSIIESLTANDKSIIRELVQTDYSRSHQYGNILSRLPESRIGEYFEACLEKFSMEGIDPGSTIVLFALVMENVNKLPEKVLANAIEQQINITLDQDTSNSNTVVVQFISKYLYSCTQKPLLQSRLEIIWKALMKLRDNSKWNSKGKEGNYPARLIARSILDTICSSVFNISGTKKNSREILDYFCEKIQKIDKLSIDFFNQLVLMQIALIIHTQKPNEDWQESSKKIEKLVNSYVSKYQGEIIGPLCDALIRALEFYEEVYRQGDTWSPNLNPERMYLTDGLLKLQNISKHVAIVAVKLLPEVCPTKPQLAGKFDQAQQILQNWPDETVKLFL